MREAIGVVPGIAMSEGAGVRIARLTLPAIARFEANSIAGDDIEDSIGTDLHCHEVVRIRDK